MKARLKLSAKQAEAWETLRKSDIIELLFGGGAGGGKSELGCMIIVDMAMRYPETRYFMGRESLEDFKKSTLLTLIGVLKKWGLKADRDYVHNQQDKKIYFRQTGSEIYYSEVAFYPSDPEYDYLGSTEYTWAFLDEANQVREKGKNVIRTRLRYKLKEYGLTAKLFMTCNPSKGHLYTGFYKPWKEGKLPRDRAFIQSLVTDNPFIDPSYIQNLIGIPDKATKERLLFGNWEYDDDPSALMTYDSITDIFTNNVPVSQDRFIVVDVARKGKDMTTISYWEGYDCKRIAGYKKLLTVPDPNDPARPSTAGKVLEWMRLHNVPLSHVLVDEDGVGGGVKDYLGCKGFTANSKAFVNPVTRMPENYENVKAQCGWALAKRVNQGQLAVRTTNPTIKKFLIEDLEQVKQKDADKDGIRLALVSKQVTKLVTGRSPDFGDLLIMRMWFDYQPKPNIQWM
jgi:phage terminase large subunit